MFSVLIPTFNQSRVRAFRILTYCRPIGGIFCLLLSERFPKSGQLFILKLAYGFTDTVHGCRTQVIMGAGAFNAGDKADIGFVIAGRSVKECGKLLGPDQGAARLFVLPCQQLRPGKDSKQRGAYFIEVVRLICFPQPQKKPGPPIQGSPAGKHDRHS